MAMKTKLAMALAVLVMVGMLAPSANAWYGGGSFWCGAYPGYWLPPSLLQERPPYFAFYPPVYYSHPVYAPYGVRPYPRGASIVATSAPVVPLTVTNRYVESDVAVAGTGNANSGPVRIANPFASPEKDDRAMESQVRSQPQVVYPVSLARTGR